MDLLGENGIEVKQMSKINYEMKPVTEKREKKYSSIIDPIINDFLDSEEDLVEVTVEGRTSSYMKAQLTKRIATRKLEIEVSKGYGVFYLEKKKE